MANPRQLACAPRPNMGANVSAAIQETLDHAERHLFPLEAGSSVFPLEEYDDSSTASFCNLRSLTKPAALAFQGKNARDSRDGNPVPRRADDWTPQLPATPETTTKKKARRPRAGRAAPERQGTRSSLSSSSMSLAEYDEASSRRSFAARRADRKARPASPEEEDYRLDWEDDVEVTASDGAIATPTTHELAGLVRHNSFFSPIRRGSFASEGDDEALAMTAADFVARRDSEQARGGAAESAY